MADITPSVPLEPIASLTLDLPRLSTSHDMSRSPSASRLQSLYEINYLPQDERINNTILPLINPYTAFTKPPPFSPFKTIKFIIRPTQMSVKEYVQSTCFDQHQILAS